MLHMHMQLATLIHNYRLIVVVIMITSPSITVFSALISVATVRTSNSADLTLQIISVKR